MKWEKPIGSVQYSVGRQYCVVHANSKDWIAYRINPTTAAEIVGATSDEAARAACEAFDRQQQPQRKSA